MSDFVWYSRLLVWAGCAGLLIQAVTGRAFGFVTLVSVIFLVVGFVGFLAGLALEGRSMAWITALAEAPPVGEPPSEVGVVLTSPQSESPLRREATPPAVTHPELSVDNFERVELPAGHDLTEPHVPTGATPPGVFSISDSSPSHSELQSSTEHRGRRVSTEELQAASGAIGAPCRRCERRFEEADIVAMCWSCGSRHHAGCWIENRFRCSTPECRGEGSLDAPLMHDQTQS